MRVVLTWAGIHRCFRVDPQPMLSFPSAEILGKQGRKKNVNVVMAVGIR